MGTKHVRGSRHKWVEHDYDFLQALDETPCSFCLSPTTVKICLGELSEVGWKTRYFSELDTEVDQQVIFDWQQKAILELMSGCCDDNLLTITINNTTTNNIAFRQTVINRYDGTNPNSINPNAPNDNWNGDDSDARNAALCMALKNYFTQYLNDAINQSFAGGFIGGALFATGLLLLVSGVGFIPGLLIISSFGGIAALISAFPKAELSGFIDQITCCAKDALEGQPITRASWAACLDSCSVSGGAADLRDLFKTGLSSNWEVFVNTLGDAFVAAEAGIEDCPTCCPEVELPWDWYNTTDDLTGWTVGSVSDIDPSLITACFDPLATYHMNLQINADGMGHNFVANTPPFGGFSNDHYAQCLYHDIDLGGCALVHLTVFTSVADSSSSSVKLWVHDADGWHYAAGIDITGTGGTPTVHVADLYEVDIDQFAILTYSGTNVYLGQIILTTN